MNKILSLYGLLITCVFSLQTFAAVTVPSPLVDVNWLEKNRNNVVILDVRKNTKSFLKMPVYKKDKKSGKKKLKVVAGHIPGSRMINYKQLRANKMINGKKVQKMLVGKAAFESVIQNAGVNKGDVVIIVSRGTGNYDMTMATRLYWQLKYYGNDNMAILDGGVGAWLKAGNKVVAKSKSYKKGSWVATAQRNEILATSNDVRNAVKNNNVQLVDTRPISLYFGTWRKNSYVYKDGHIPGAKNFPNELLTKPGAPARFIGNPELKSIMSELGIDTGKQSITYCNSGHLASGSWFVLSELMGNKNTKMYDGSMHEWTLENNDVVTMKRE